MTIARSSTAAATPASALRSGLALLPHALLLAAFMCAAFSAAASTFLLLAMPLAGIEESHEFFLRLGFKALAFIALTAFVAHLLRRFMRTFPPRLPARPIAPDEHYGMLGLLLILCLFALLLFPRLASYPWTAPDELHHLIVVRNLSQIGEYASGHPEDSLVKYDSYDSVGPAVIVPVAATYTIFESLTAARAAIASAFLAWIASFWLLLRPVFGARAAGLGVALAGTAIGSIYLGRTVYGEVPAFLYATAGLLYWRAALGRISHIPWSLLAGLCFGFVILSKSILILMVFPVLAVCAFDWLSFKRIKLSRLLLPAAAAVAVVVGWTVYKAVGGAESDFAATLHLYRHYLLFGLESAGATLGWFAENWLTSAMLLLGFVSVLPLVLMVRYDPAVLTLILTAVLYGFWWIFFTPGQIPRYLWYTLCIGGACAGPLAYCTAQFAIDGTHRPMSRVAAALLLLAIAVPSALELNRVIQRTWRSEQMMDEYALRNFLSNNDQELSTTSWMAQRSANFFTFRHLPLVDAESTGVSVLIRDHALEEFEAPRAEAIGSGRYVIIRGKP